MPFELADPLRREKIQVDKCLLTLLGQNRYNRIQSKESTKPKRIQCEGGRDKAEYYGLPTSTTYLRGVKLP
jgi:hypothetical protein